MRTSTSSPTTTPRRSARGFALIVVLVIAAAAVAIAVGIQGASGSAKVAAVHASSGDRVATLATSALERAEAYAREVASGADDFDAVLDPNTDANCAPLLTSGTVAETGGMYLPRFTGSTVTLPAPWRGRYRRVAADGGAYFVRYEDDADDVLDPLLLLGAAVGNTIDGPSACVEGSAALGGPSNPARDANGRIWVTVIAIHPAAPGVTDGSDLLAASHRQVLRQMITLNSSVDAGPGTPGLAPMCTRNGDIQSGGEQIMCTSVTSAPASASGNIQPGSGNNCGCGEDLSEWSTNCASPPAFLGPAIAPDVTARCCGGNTSDTNVADQCADANLITTDSNVLYDWSSFCNFAFSGGRLFYWDPAGTGRTGFPGATCGTWNGNAHPPSTTITNPGSCWIPVAGHGTNVCKGATTVPFPRDETCDALAAPAGDGIGTADRWCPRGGAGAVTSTGTCGYFTAPVAYTMPDWSQCPETTLYDFDWSAGPPGGPATPGSGAQVLCSNCDGVTPALKRVNTGLWLPIPLSDGATAANVRAVVPGMYIATNLDVPTGYNNNVFGFTGKPSDGDDYTKWPMMTLRVRDSGGIFIATNEHLVVGIGVRPGALLSVMGQSNNLKVNGSGAVLQTLGSVNLDDGSVQIEAGGKFWTHGAVLADNGNIQNTDSNTSVRMFYDVDLYAIAAGAAAAPPSVERAPLTYPAQF